MEPRPTLKAVGHRHARQLPHGRRVRFMEDEKRNDDFKEARRLNDDEKSEAAWEKIGSYLEAEAIELSVFEMEIVASIIEDTITASAFGDDKKASCYRGIETLEKIKLEKDSIWLTAYVGVVYEAFSKMNRCARDEERENVWCRLKELFIEILSLARKVWKDKNSPPRLDIYLLLAKLVKSYLDVADEETFKLCEDAAKEAKYMGKGTLEDEEWRDANKTIQDINKNINDAVSEKELLHDSD